MAFPGAYPRLTPAGIGARATGTHTDAVEHQITTMHSGNTHRTCDSGHWTSTLRRHAHALLDAEDAARAVRMRAVHTALQISFWALAALIVWTQLGYGLLIAALAGIFAPAPQASTTSLERPNPPNRPASAELTAHDDNGVIGGTQTMPSVSLIVAAHDEQTVIGAKVLNALALTYPRELLEVVVSCDGCADSTAQRARAAAPWPETSFQDQ